MSGQGKRLKRIRNKGRHLLVDIVGFIMIGGNGCRPSENKKG